MKGRALIDLPDHKLKCGEYGEIEDKFAKPLAKAGHFDPKAVKAPATEEGLDNGTTTDPDSTVVNSGAGGEGSPGAGPDPVPDADQAAPGSGDAGTPLF